MAGCTDGQFNLHPWDFSWLHCDIMSLNICVLFISYSRKQRMPCLSSSCCLSVLLIAFIQQDTIAFTKEHLSEYIYHFCLLRDPCIFVLKCNNDIVIEQICGSRGDKCLYDHSFCNLVQICLCYWLIEHVYVLCVVLKPCINWNWKKKVNCRLFSNTAVDHSILVVNFKWQQILT